MKSHVIVAAMARIDFYRVLGVSRDASDDAVKKAYRKLVFQHHPDRHPESTQAEAKIRELNAAYEIIGDPEKRRNYDRLNWGDETTRDEAIDPAVILDEMELKLFDEGRKEIFAVLMKDVKRIKSELAVIRERTVADQGYDTFKEAIIRERAAEIMDELITPDMEGRKQRLVEVATEMLLSQGVANRGDEGGVRSLGGQLEDVFRKGRIKGFASALELFYERR
ncbi:MAG: DnaJ domain-containing protein [Nitrospirota bacterium]|nr:DnaJ domain-containing protein [Nitrospirota bacterium]MDP2383099.1 DnaJ domain-containing protein [Nitrospirota bacterium]MDP3598562.1 DnaJ domain-containing protein [Nitrospirota bacterium]